MSCGSLSSLIDVGFTTHEFKYYIYVSSCKRKPEVIKRQCNNYIVCPTDLIVYNTQQRLSKQRSLSQLNRWCQLLENNKFTCKKPA